MCVSTFVPGPAPWFEKGQLAIGISCNISELLFCKIDHDSIGVLQDQCSIDAGQHATSKMPHAAHVYMKWAYATEYREQEVTDRHG